MGDRLRDTVVGPALESHSPPLPLQAAHRGQGGRRERPGHQRISEAPLTGTPNVQLSSPEVSVREGPRQLTHNCRLELIVVILCSAYLHLHKGTCNASSGFGEMTGPQNLGPQEPSVRILPPSLLTLHPGQSWRVLLGWVLVSSSQTPPPLPCCGRGNG